VRGIAPIAGPGGRRVLGEIALGLGFAAFGAGIALVADGTPTIPGQAYGAGFFPILIGWAMAAVGGLIALRALRIGVPGEAGPLQRRAPFPAALAWTVLGLVGVILLFETVGFVALMTVYVGVFMLLLRVPAAPAMAIAAGASLAVDLLFVRFLLVPLPPGILSGLLR
jgi:putative tricarboxylic transport membrane protein